MTRRSWGPLSCDWLCIESCIFSGSKCVNVQNMSSIDIHNQWCTIVAFSVVIIIIIIYYYSDIFLYSRALHCNYATLLGRMF